jgi:hypothetical protein
VVLLCSRIPQSPDQCTQGSCLVLSSSVTIRDPAPQFCDWGSLSRNRSYIEFCPNHRSTISPSIAISPRRTTPSPLLQLELHPVFRLYNNSLLFRLVSSRLASGRRPWSLTFPPSTLAHSTIEIPPATVIPTSPLPSTAARLTPHCSTAKATHRPCGKVLQSSCEGVRRYHRFSHFALSQGGSYRSAAAARTRRFQPSCNTNVLANQQGPVLVVCSVTIGRTAQKNTQANTRGPSGQQREKDRNNTCPADKQGG